MAASLRVTTPGRYSLETTTPDGCQDLAQVLITNGNCPVIIPNIITPNGDSQNEYFVLKNSSVSEWNLLIHNKWGRQVYQRSAYDNSWNAAGQPDGVYYYLLTNPATGERYKGWVEVRR